MATWQRTKGDEKRLLRTARKGDTFYGTVSVSRRVAPYEDGQLADRWTVTHMHPILGGPMCGSRSLASLLHEFGPLSDRKPDGLRGLWEPAPQVAGPVDPNQIHTLDEAELRGLTKRNRDAIREQKKAGRKGWL